MTIYDIIIPVGGLLLQLILHDPIQYAASASVCLSSPTHSPCHAGHDRVPLHQKTQATEISGKAQFGGNNRFVALRWNVLTLTTGQPGDCREIH
jgi:hypothetical protein